MLPILHLNIVVATSIQFLLMLIPTSLLLRKLTFNPDTASNNIKFALIILIFSHPFSPIISVSSAYYRRVNLSSPLSNFFKSFIFVQLYRSFHQQFETFWYYKKEKWPLKPSATIRKINDC